MLFLNLKRWNGENVKVLQGPEAAIEASAATQNLGHPKCRVPVH